MGQVKFVFIKNRLMGLRADKTWLSPTKKVRVVGVIRVFGVMSLMRLLRLTSFMVFGLTDKKKNYESLVNRLRM